MVILNLRGKSCISTANFNSSLPLGIIFTENLVSNCNHSLHSIFLLKKIQLLQQLQHHIGSKRQKEYFTKVCYPCVLLIFLLYTMGESEYFPLMLCGYPVLNYSLKVFIFKCSRLPTEVFLYFKYKCIPVEVCKMSLANLNNED